jgi:hypothetical protein
MGGAATVVKSWVKRPISRAGARWLSHSSLDFVLIALIFVTHLALHLTCSIPGLLEGVPTDKRPGLYGATATVVSLTGTLASVTVAQYLSNRGDRIKELKRLYPKTLARTWRGVFLGSVLATLLFLISYALDLRTKSSNVGSWIFELGALIAVFRFIRLAVLFGNIVELVVLDDTDPVAPQLTTFSGAMKPKAPIVPKGSGGQ